MRGKEKKDMKELKNDIVEIVKSKRESERGKQKNIKIEDILRLRAKGLSTTEIAKLLNCNHQNVSNRLRACYFDKDTVAYVRKNFPELILSDYTRIREHINAKKLKKASALDLAKMQALLYKQYRLESDKSTENVALNLKQINTEITELERKIEELEGGDEDLRI